METSKHSRILIWRDEVHQASSPSTPPPPSITPSTTTTTTTTLSSSSSSSLRSALAKSRTFLSLMIRRPDDDTDSDIPDDDAAHDPMMQPAGWDERAYPTSMYYMLRPKDSPDALQPREPDELGREGRWRRATKLLLRRKPLSS